MRPSLVVGPTAGRRVWCVCSCGRVTAPWVHNLKNGHTTSCGCGRGNSTNHVVKHGHNRTGRDDRPPSPTYKSWQAMLSRCYSPRTSGYPNYGGAGIRVCDRWRSSFENFLADMGERPPGTSLDRFPRGSGDYEPGNCRWATKSEQSQNLKSNVLKPHRVRQIRWLHEGGLSFSAIADLFGVSRQTVANVAQGKSWTNIA